MTDLDQTKEGAAEATTTQESLLDRALEATLQTPVDTTKELLSALTTKALQGSLVWDKNVGQTIAKAVAGIDAVMSKQLSAIMQEDTFKTLEGSWRGLQKVVKESEIGANQKIRLVDFSKDELLEQFEEIGRAHV